MCELGRLFGFASLLMCALASEGGLEKRRLELAEDNLLAAIIVR